MCIALRMLLLRATSCWLTVAAVVVQSCSRLPLVCYYGVNFAVELDVLVYK